MKPLRVLSIFGTRPEAVKMPPVLQALQELQQRELLPAWVLLCCSLLLQETEKPRKAR
jgi:hypothetical protein